MMDTKELTDKLLLLTPKQRETIDNVISTLLQDKSDDNNKDIAGVSA